MFLFSSYIWDWEPCLVFFWQQDPENVPFHVSESEYLIFPATPPLPLLLCWLQPLDTEEPAVETFSFPRKCVLVPLMTLSNPLIVLSTEGSLLPPRTARHRFKIFIKKNNFWKFRNCILILGRLMLQFILLLLLLLLLLLITAALLLIVLARVVDYRMIWHQSFL